MNDDTDDNDSTLDSLHAGELAAGADDAKKLTDLNVNENSENALLNLDAFKDDILSDIQKEVGDRTLNLDAFKDDILSDIQKEVGDGTLNLDAFNDDILSDIQGELTGSKPTAAPLPQSSQSTPQEEGRVVSKAPISDSDIDALLFGGENEKNKDLSDNPSDIEALLGFDLGSKGSHTARKGMEAILKKTMIYYERLPMLEVVFDRLIRLLSTNLRNFTSDNVEIKMESSKSTRFGDYLNSIPLPAMLGVFKANEWDNQGLIVVDSALIYSIVDVLLGGRHSSSGLSLDGRMYTTIECNLIEKLMYVFLEDLSAAFEPVSPVQFVFERLEVNPHFALISRASNAGILVKLSVEIDDRFGKISLFLPYATIEPIRELLLQNFMGEKFGRDSIWEHHLISELKETEITFDIHLLSEMMQLSKVLNLKVGDSIYFASNPQTQVTAKSGEHSLFRGIVGHKNGKVAIKIQENLLDLVEYEAGDAGC
ncbi:MAG: flagellar motor switch protein FliM [Pseudomonadota bacterium]